MTPEELQVKLKEEVSQITFTDLAANVTEYTEQKLLLYGTAFFQW